MPDCVESRIAVRRNESDLSSFFQGDEMIQALSGGSGFRKTPVWHQRGKTITHWLLKPSAKSVGASLMVIKARHTAEPWRPHINGEKQQYRRSPILTVYFDFIKKSLGSGNWAAQALLVSRFRAATGPRALYRYSLLNPHNLHVCVFLIDHVLPWQGWMLDWPNGVRVCFNSGAMLWSLGWQIWFSASTSQELGCRFPTP